MSTLGWEAALVHPGESRGPVRKHAGFALEFWTPAFAGAHISIVRNRSKADITLRSEQLVDRLVEIGAVDKQQHRVAAVEPEARTVPVGQGAARRVLQQT